MNTENTTEAAAPQQRDVTNTADVAALRRLVGGTVVTYWVLHIDEATRGRVVSELDRYGIAVGAGGDWLVVNGHGDTIEGVPAVVIESGSGQALVERLTGTDDASIEAYAARIVTALAGLIAENQDRPEQHNAAAAPQHQAGDIVRITRPDGGVDLVEIIAPWTATRTGTDMYAVVRRPYGVFSFDVRADAVVVDDEPDGDMVDCRQAATVTNGTGAACEQHRPEFVAAHDLEDNLTLREAAPGQVCGEHLRPIAGGAST